MTLVTPCRVCHLRTTCEEHRDRRAALRALRVRTATIDCEPYWRFDLGDPVIAGLTEYQHAYGETVPTPTSRPVDVTGVVVERSKRPWRVVVKLSRAVQGARVPYSRYNALPRDLRPLVGGSLRPGEDGGQLWLAPLAPTEPEEPQ